MKEEGAVMKVRGGGEQGGERDEEDGEDQRGRELLVRVRRNGRDGTGDGTGQDGREA